LAIYRALIEFRCYVEGREFVIITEHKPNTGMFKAMTRMQSKWVSLMETFRNQGMGLVYQPSRTTVADPLSRHPSFVSAYTTSRVKRLQPASQLESPSSPCEGEGPTPSITPSNSAAEADMATNPETPVPAGEQGVQSPPPPHVFPELEKHILEGYATNPCFADSRNTVKRRKEATSGLAEKHLSFQTRRS
jgi:hypothetical protein